MAISSVLSKIFGSQGDDVGRAVARTALKDYADTSKLSDIGRQLQDRFNNQSPVMTYQQYIDSYR